jgi:hypothetical protein
MERDPPGHLWLDPLVGAFTEGAGQGSSCLAKPLELSPQLLKPPVAVGRARVEHAVPDGFALLPGFLGLYLGAATTRTGRAAEL